MRHPNESVVDLRGGSVTDAGRQSLSDITKSERSMKIAPALRPDTGPDTLLNRYEIAALMGVAPSTLARYVANNTAPPSFRVSGRRVFPLSAYRTWLATRLAAENRKAA